MTTYALAAIALLATGCTSPMRLVRPRSCPAQPLESERVSLELLVPHAKRDFMPPIPVPTTTRGSRVVIRAVIDTSGYVMRDSITICGLRDPMYAQRVAEEVSQMRFRPGLLHAKHVVAPTLFTYAF